SLLLGVNRSLHPGHRSRPQQPLDLLAFGRDLGHAFDAAPSAAALLRQHVVARRLAMDQLALASDPESLGGRAVGLHLHGHPSLASDAGAGSASGSRSFAVPSSRMGGPGSGTAARAASGAGSGTIPDASAAASLACCSWYRLFGAITMIMLRPSCFGIISTTIISPKSSTSRSKILRPSSVCAISRPRNMIVILTLAPTRRNRTTWPFFVA